MSSGGGEELGGGSRGVIESWEKGRWELRLRVGELGGGKW